MPDIQSSVGTHTSMRALTKIKMSSYYLNSANIFTKQMIELENCELSQKERYEFCSYGVFSIISAVMGLEAYVNEVLSDTVGIHADLPEDTSSNILVEKRVRKLYQIKGVSDAYSLSDNARNLIYLRNEYVHYDDEAMGGDTILMPVGRRETLLNNALIYFQQLIANGTITRSKVYPDSDLFPLGLLSSTFSEWVTNTVMLEINKIISQVGSRSINIV